MPLTLTLVSLALSLTACSTPSRDTLDYKSKSDVTMLKLESPPDLTQLSRKDRYPTSGPVTANGYQAGLADAPGAPTAVSSVGDVRLEKSSSQHWLIVNRSTDQLWDSVRDFWQESGFLLTIDQRDLGIMETDWAENRAKPPQDLVRSTVGKLSDTSYATGELRRFRTRLERGQNGGSEIYLTYRGMVEVRSTATKDQTVWQTRPADPELEAEFLRRLMVRLGALQAQSEALDASTKTMHSSRVTTMNGRPVLQMDGDFERVWRRVGLALDRTGFTVEDRDRNAGVYFVRYVTPNMDKKEPNLFTKIWNLGKPDVNVVPLKLRISVESHDSTSTVSVLNEAGAPDTTENAKRIVEVIAADLS